MKRIAIYARQSIDKKDSISIDTQISTCKKRLSDNEENRVDVYIDKGYSGKNTNRPDLKRMLKQLEQNKIEIVIVYKLDRISRNITDFYNLYEIMVKHHCEFCSATENFDTTTPMGKAMMGILVVFAQMERENIQKRVKDNYYDRIEKQGSWPGGPAPFGWKNARTDDRRPTLEPIEEEKNAVEFLFSSYAYDLNVSLGQLARKMYDKGYRSRNRTEGRFDNVTIARILKNPVYVKADGILYNHLRGRGIKVMGDEKDWNGSHSAHIVNKKTHVDGGNKKYTSESEWTAYLTNFSGYIDSRTFVLVQNRLDTNRQLGRANAGSKLEEFAGILKCGECGHAIKIYSGDQLSCYGKTSLHICHSRFSSRFFGHTLLNKLYLDRIRFVVSRQIARYYSILRMSYQKQHEEYSRLEQKKKELEQNQINLVNALAYCDTEEARRPIVERNNELSKRIADIDIRMANLAEVNLIEIKDNINYYNLSVKKRKAIVDKLIDKIVITDYSSTQPDFALDGRDYGIDVVWKHDIEDEFKELFEKTMANMTDEDKNHYLIETMYGMPYEDYQQIQEESQRDLEEVEKMQEEMQEIQRTLEDKWADDAKKGIIYTVQEGQSITMATPYKRLKHGCKYFEISFDYNTRNDRSIMVKEARTFYRYGDSYEDVRVLKSPEYWEKHIFSSYGELDRFGHEYVHEKAEKDI